MATERREMKRCLNDIFAYCKGEPNTIEVEGNTYQNLKPEVERCSKDIATCGNHLTATEHYAKVLKPTKAKRRFVKGER